MLLEFSVKNFMSFKERNTFSMIASTDSTLIDNVIEKDNVKLLKSTAIYGANASGKSNLFKALRFVVWYVSNSNLIVPGARIPVIPFKLSKNSIEEASEFEIKLLINDVKYIYNFKVNSKEVLEENLYYYPNGYPTKIFVRTETDKYEYSTDKKILTDIEEKNTNNKLFLSTATTWNYDRTRPIYDFISKNIMVVFDLETLNYFAFNKYYNDEDKSLKKFALRFLKKADFNIEEFEVFEDKMTDDKLKIVPNIIKDFIPVNSVGYRVSTVHKCIDDDNETTFDLSEESLGTQAIFALIPALKDVIDNGKILVFDELDKSLHPTLIKYIVELFNDSDMNSNSAQLIFNTHDTNLLNSNLLRRDQIWFTEKNFKDGSSVIYPLDDFSVRKDENIEKGYLVGRYGAIPFLENNFDDLKDII